MTRTGPIRRKAGAERRGRTRKDGWMGNRTRPRLTYANVVSTLALFGVLAGGGAYAHHRGGVGPQQIQKDAVKKRHVDRNAIAARELRPRAVGSRSIASNAIRPRHILEGAVTEDKLADGVAVSGPRGPEGPEGPRGPEGPEGPPGPATGPAGGDLSGSYPDPSIARSAIGASKLDGPYRVRGSEVTVPAGEGRQASAFCDFNDQILSGGIETTRFGPGQTGFEVRNSFPSFTSIPLNQWSWSVNVANNSSGEMRFRPHALCLRR